MVKSEYVAAEVSTKGPDVQVETLHICGGAYAWTVMPLRTKTVGVEDVKGQRPSTVARQHAICELFDNFRLTSKARLQTTEC